MISIIGCGNVTRSDDGVGVFVAQHLNRVLAHRTDVCVFDAGTSGVDVMFKSRGAKKLIIIDAGIGGGKAGEIMEIVGADLQNLNEPTCNLHDFRWDHAIHMGKKIFKEDFPDDITVFLIEPGDLSLGLEMTEPVRRAANQLIKLIVRKLE